MVLNFTKRAAELYRDFVADGVPSSGKHRPVKSDIRTYGKQIEDYLDTGVLLRVLDRDLGVPPGAPALGDRYIVGPSASGAWAGHTNEIAEWNGAGWTFSIADADRLVWMMDEKRLYYFSGVTWTPQAAVATRQMRTVTENGNISLLDTDDLVILKPAAPSVRNVTIASATSRPLLVMDGNGDWGAFNVTFLADGGGTINGQPSWRGLTNFGSFEFVPRGGGNFLAR